MLNFEIPIPKSEIDKEERVMSNEIWVFAEQQEGKVKKITFELLSAGNEFSKKTGQPVAVLLLGSGLEEAVKSLTPFADKIYLMDNPVFSPYTSMPILPPLHLLSRNINLPSFWEERPLREKTSSQGWPWIFRQAMPLTARV